MKAVIFLISLLVITAAAAHFQHLEEWNTWKNDYEKSYISEREELERHIIWLSNKAYVEAHNANSHIFGYRVGINNLADMVCCAMINCLFCCLVYMLHSIDIFDPAFALNVADRIRIPSTAQLQASWKFYSLQHLPANKRC